MYCEHCGQGISESAKFCRFCGKEIAAAPAAEAASPEGADQSTEAAGPKSPQSRRHGWQPLNVVLGLLSLSTVLAAAPLGFPPLSFLRDFGPAIIAALILILTRRNNLKVGAVLLILGLLYGLAPIFFGPTLDRMPISPPSFEDGPEFALPSMLRILYVATAYARLLILVAALFVIASAVSVRVKGRPFAVLSLLTALLPVAIVFWEPMLSLTEGVVHPQPRVDEIVETIDPRISVRLSGAVPPRPEMVKNSFFSGEDIYPMEEGLARGARYGFRVVESKGSEIISVNRWGLGPVRMGQGLEGSGLCNSADNPLAPGSYTVQLVRVGGERGFVVAEAPLTITSALTSTIGSPSGVQVWLTLENDPNARRYETIELDSTRGADLYVWVEGPAGRAIPGKVQLLRPDGSIRNQFDFKTDAAGRPIKVMNGSGNVPPGEYPIKILVEGKVVAEAAIVSR